MSASADSRDAADQPFGILKALETQARASVSGHGIGAESEAEWVGLGFRVGDLKLIVSRDQISELMQWPGAHPVPGAANWMLGIANVRGQLLPITDMKAFLGGEESGVTRSARVLAVDHADVLAGLLVDEVYGFRRFHENESGQFDTSPLPAARTWISGSFSRGDETWGVIDLRALVESPPFLQAAS